MGCLSSCLSNKGTSEAVVQIPAQIQPPAIKVVAPEQVELLEQAKEDFQRGNNLFRDNQVGLAIGAYSCALSKLKRYEAYPECDEDIPDTLTGLAAQHFAEGRILSAKALLSEAGKQRSLLPDHRVLRDPCLLSLAEEMQREIVDRRAPPFQHVLVADVQQHKSIDAITADVMNNLGACFEVQSNLEQARQFYKESLKLRKVVFGERSLKCAEAMQNLATALDALGQKREAQQLFTTALGIEEELRGRDNIENSVTMSNLGVLSAHLGDLPRAEELLQRCVAVRRREYGEVHELTQCAVGNLERVRWAIAEGQSCATFGAEELKSEE